MRLRRFGAYVWLVSVRKVQHEASQESLHARLAYRQGAYAWRFPSGGFSHVWWTSPGIDDTSGLGFEHRRKCHEQSKIQPGI